MLSQLLREVTVEALPLEIPEHIELDVSGMEIGGTLRISDLAAPEGTTLLDDPESVVATITAPTREVEPEPTEEELAAMEAEGEGAEGEEACRGRGCRRRSRAGGGVLRRRRHRRGLVLLVVGLGNPGREHARNRHNAGWMVVDELARRHDGSWRGKFSGPDGGGADRRRSGSHS